MVIIQFLFENFILIMAIVLVLIFANMNKRKRFIKKADKNGWKVAGKSCEHKLGHYYRNGREIHTHTVTYKYEVKGKEYLIKKKYESISNTFPDLTTKTVYYNPKNPKKAYV